VFEIARKGLTIQRYKGLGEMNPEQLWETTLDPNVRVLLQVRVAHADEGGEIEAKEIFETLMGAEVKPRYDFITSRAREVINLDV
jgi:DNA gyrase subunit B